MNLAGKAQFPCYLSPSSSHLICIITLHLSILSSWPRYHLHHQHEHHHNTHYPTYIQKVKIKRVKERHTRVLLPLTYIVAFNINIINTTSNTHIAYIKHMEMRLMK